VGGRGGVEREEREQRGGRGVITGIERERT
jgi:hypothetical protein